jgi:CTP synthase
VIEALDAETIYEVPMMFAKRELDVIVAEKLHLKKGTADLDDWSRFVHRIKSPKRSVTIGLVGKYVKYKDSYKSISEAFVHAGAVNNAHVDVQWIDSEQVNPNHVSEKLAGVDGILVAPGFGSRGIEGKITAIRHVRENGIPFFGICLGMQCAVIEYARNVAGLTDANSSEFKRTKSNVIDLMPDQKGVVDKGGTMRLGAYKARLQKGSLAMKAYKAEEISERHRHRYEFNNNFREALTKHGMKLTGLSPDGRLVEIIEVPKHPWFLGVQFHPELMSRAVTAHPLFTAFVKATLTHKERSA